MSDGLGFIRGVLFIAAFAQLNRARGSQFFDTLGSTAEGRVIVTFLMGVITAMVAGGDYLDMAETLLWVWASLMLWCVFAWDNYWGAAIGSIFYPNKATLAPVDWLMRSMPWFAPVYIGTAGDVRRRLWGAVAMGLRQSLAAPCLIGLAYMTGHLDHGWYAAGSLLFGFIYMAAGYLVPVAYAIPLAEPAVGAALGALVLAVL